MGFGERIGLSGLSRSSMKKHPAILPIYFLLGCGLTLSISACLRTLFKHPEVSITRHSNPEPWKDFSERQYKFFSVGRDYKDADSQSKAPTF